MDEIYTIGERVGGLLKARGETISVAESAAGGLISAALLSAPGASSYYLGGGVIYTHDARRGLIGLIGEQVIMDGASEPFALLMASSMLQRVGSIWAIGESGAAGPTGSRYGHPSGYVALAIAGPIEQVSTVQTGSNNRQDNMVSFACAGLKLLEEVLSR